MIKLSVPGTLRYRDVVLRVTASACKLARSGAKPVQDTGQEIDDEFESKVVSAVSEAFNNIAIHGYGEGAAGEVDLEFQVNEEGITVTLSDRGRGYDPASVSRRAPGALPESRMGLFIIDSFMDVVEYRRAESPGAPNVLTLAKRLTRSAAASAEK
jgi:anti-sigma regulatory factor (Ser/Thr protein kinase)